LELVAFIPVRYLSLTKKLQPFFRKVIEMGRAYVNLEYQQKPLPLFLLVERNCACLSQKS
jgi:hypothetical protein